MGLIADWVKQYRERQLLKKQGFIVYCRCGLVLNDKVAAVPVDDKGIYSWTCPTCKAVSQFDLDAPVPLLVSSHDPA